MTSRDVAKKAGVSRTTVSFVLNDVKEGNISEETRQRVLAAAKELNYVPNAAAQALAGQRTRIIGLVFSGRFQHLPTHFFLLQLMDGLLGVVQEHGLRLLVDRPGEAESNGNYLNLVRAKRIDGLIMIEPQAGDVGLHALAKDRFPTVLIGNLPGVEICSVDVDNRGAARAAVAHLLALGHHRIACITNAPLPSYTATEERLLGYRDALEEAGVPYDENLVCYGGYTSDSGYSSMATLLDSSPLRPSAVFVASDVVAFGAMTAIQERGLEIPNDISVVGFDDVPMARFVSPSLTTVHLPVAEQGRKAAELLLDLIRKRAEPGRRIVLDTELVIRNSSTRRQESS